MLVLTIAALLPVAAGAKSKRHDASSQTSRAAKPQGSAEIAADQRRDPADIALDKKIKSICRGC